MKITPPLKDPYPSPHRKWQRNVSISLKNSEGVAAQPWTEPTSLEKSPGSSRRPRQSSLNPKSTTPLDRTSASWNNTCKTLTRNVIADSTGSSPMTNQELETSAVDPLKLDFALGRNPRSMTGNSHGSSVRTSLELGYPTTYRKPSRAYAPMPRILNTQNPQSSPRLTRHNSQIPNGLTSSSEPWSTSITSSPVLSPS